jgi:hypothetical protein
VISSSPARPASALGAQVEAWRRRLEPARSDDAFLAAWARVSSEVAALDPERAAALESEEGRHLRGGLAPYQRRFLLLAEREEAQRLLERPAAPGASLGERLNGGFARRTFERLREAAGLVDLARCEHAVVVGCGAFPAAACFLHERAPRAAVTALDVDRDAADLARRVAERLGHDRIRVACRDGRDHDYTGAAVVYVVNQVEPKPEVLRRVAATAPLDATVLLRDPAGPGRLLADSVDGALPDPWRVAAVGRTDPGFLSRHLLLARR